MTKCLRHILMLVVFTAWGISGWGQSFIPDANNDQYPTGDDQGSFEPNGGLVCAYCAADPQTQTFRIAAFDEGTPFFLNDSYFEWVVFGGIINGYSGLQVGGASYLVGTNNRQYIRTQATDGPDSWIEVQFDAELPATVWVAVRQTSGLGCTDDKWAVYLMQGDTDAPSISGFPSDVPHLAWELRNNYPFTVPTISDDCESCLSFSMSVNGGAPVDLIGSMDTEVEINLIGEAPGDVNADLTGVDNTVVFTWSDGANENTSTWNIHVDYRPNVIQTSAIDPVCPGNSNGEISVDYDIEVENSVVGEYSTDNVNFSTLEGSLLPNLVQGDYYFRVSTLVNGYRSYSDTLQVTLTDPPTINVTEVTPLKNETCVGSSDGDISISIDYTDGLSNPFRAYTITWTKDGAPYTPANNLNPTGLDMAVYHLNITDALGCAYNNDFNIIVDNGYDPTFSAEASAMTMIDPLDPLADGYVDLNVDAGNCTFNVLDNSFNPSAIDDACGTTGLTLLHDYTGTDDDPWADATTLNGAHFAVGKTTVTWTATDATDNTATRIYNVYVTDNVAPTISSESNTTYPYCEPSQAIPLPTVSDNCEIASVYLYLDGVTDNYNWWPNIDAGETETLPIDFGATATNVEWVVTDVNTLGDDASYNINFTDALALTGDSQFEPVSCYGDVNGGIIIDFTGGTAPYNVTVGTFFDQTGGTQHYELTDLPPDNYTITITDADGCYITWDITVVEPTPIVITKDNQTDNTCFEDENGSIDLTVSGGNGGYLYNWSGPTYSYGDGHPWHLPVPVDFTGAGDDVAGLPTGQYALTVTDSKGCTEPASYEIYATDAVAPTYDDMSGGFARTTDADQCTYTVIGDEFDPQNITDDCTILVSHDYATAPLTNSLAGAVFPEGVTEVMWTIYDLNGNGNVEISTIIITDEQDPVVVTCPANVTMNADPGECSALIPTLVTDFVVTDNCAWPASYIDYLRSDYFWADLDYPFDARPEPVTITWLVTDASGHTNSCVQTVQISDIEDPVVQVHGGVGNPVIVNLQSNGQYTLKVSDINNGTTDNCSNLEALFVGTEGVPTIFDCDDIGPDIMVTLTARDISGNDASDDTWVSVRDVTPPTASTKQFTVELDQNGTGQLLPSDIYGGTFSDNCTSDIADMTFLVSLTSGDPGDDVDHLDLTCDDLGTTPIYLVAIDASGNRGYFNATLTVTDNGAPNITVIWNEATDFYLNSKSPNSNNAYTELDPDLFGTAVDACGADFVLTMEPAGVDCDDKGTGVQTTPVKLVATDVTNNKRAEANINLRVRDNSAPIIVAKTDEIILPGSANTLLHPDDFFANKHDNCGVTEYYIAVDAATGTDRNNGAIMATYGGRNYYNEIELRCENISSTAVNYEYFGNVTIYLYASDASGNVTTTSFTTTVRSDLTIASMELNRCLIPAASCALQGTFISNVTGGATLTSGSYYWFSENTNYQCFDPRSKVWIFCMYGQNNSNSSVNKITPGYTTWNSVTQSYEKVDLRITDANNCRATQYMTIHEQGAGVASSEFRNPVEACRDATETYSQASGTSWLWSITDASGTDISGSVTHKAILTENNFWVTWDNPALTYAEVSVVITNGACDTRVIYEVTINDLPTPSLTINPDNGAGNYCPLNEVSYQLSTTYPGYSWDIPTLNGNIVSGDDFSNAIGVEWDVPPVGGATGTVIVTVTDANGCSAPAQQDIHVEDDVAPTLTLPADESGNNIPGECTGAVSLRILEGSGVGEYNDNCGDVETVEYRTRWRFDSDTDWGTVAWGSYTESNYAPTSYDVGETQVQWRITDYSGNSTPDDNTTINTVTITDNELPGFTTSPGSFTFDADANCEYTHDADATGIDMGLIATDNCEVERIWVTFEGDATVYPDLDLGNPTVDPTDNYHFSLQSTLVTWHVQDKSGHENTEDYTVYLTDITAPEFNFDVSGLPTDGGDYTYDGTFAADERFYIFADNEDQTYNLNIPAVITDNCDMTGVDITVTLTYQDGTELQAATPITPVGDKYTINYNFPLGLTVVTWDYNDATGNFPNSVTQYIVFASKFGFGCNIEPGWVEAIHYCNPIPADFTGNATSDLPTWFDGLRTRHVLSYSVNQNSTLDPPIGSECLVSRDRQIILEYSITEFNDTDVKLFAEGNCSQTFEYFIDTEGPQIIDGTGIADLYLECDGGVQTGSHDNDIANWLASYAGLLIDDSHIDDNCSVASDMAISDDYADILSGLTCGAGSVTPVTFTIIDECGQTTDYVANIRMVDTTDPYFTDNVETPIDIATVLPNLTNVDCGSIPPVPVIGVDIFAADGCVADPTITPSSTNNRNADGISGNCDDNSYRISRTWTVTDACGNSISHTQTIDLVDNAAPAWTTVPMPDVIVDVEYCAVVPAAQKLTYTDNCDASPTYNLVSSSTRVMDPADQGYYNYDIVRTWTAEDNCTNVATHVQTIRVRDTGQPTIVTAAADMMVECNGTGNTTQLNTWLANHGGAVATDDCVSPLQLTWSNNFNDAGNPWIIDCGNAKHKLVTFTITDKSNNSVSTQATFTIVDTTIPVINGTLTTVGPYGSSLDVPAPFDGPISDPLNTFRATYPTITFTEGCLVNKDHLEITLDSETDDITTSECIYTITRTYHVTDSCGYDSAPFVQHITVNDGWPPTILKAVVDRSDCATIPANQTTPLTGLGLLASDISDNCNPDPLTYATAGDWFIDPANAALGSVKYRIINTSNHTYDVPLTNGNLDSYTFHEGVNEVYYQLTDGNGNSSALKLIYRITVLRMPEIASGIAGADVTGYGGDDYPLQNSTHTYNITMYNSGTNWGVGETGFDIYDETADDDGIAGNGAETPYSKVSDYSITESVTGGNNARGIITFDGNLATGNYVLVFTEMNSNGCFDQKFYPFTLYAPFDVDIDDTADACPSDDNSILVVGTDVNPDGTGGQTFFDYTIHLVSTNYANNWHFDYDITIQENGGGGNDASVATVTFSDGGKNNITTPSTASGTIQVTYNPGNPTTEINVHVVYNDIHGTTQLVKVALSDISGIGDDEDANVTLGTEADDTVGLDGNNDQNEVEHLIENLPLPGNVGGVE